MRRIRMPEGRSQAIKQFVLQILNTSLAVIIALSFEGLVEWRRIQNLVATARAHLHSEIADNRADVAKVLVWMSEIEGQLADVVQLTGEILAVHASRPAGQ